jgi:hypothetical protein
LFAYPGGDLAQRPTEETFRGFWARAAQSARPEPLFSRQLSDATAASQAVREFDDHAGDITASAEPITAEVLTVGALLDGRFHFRLAFLQRAYAWRPENAVRLLYDLRASMLRERPSKIYLLGRLMLARSPGAKQVEIVDGHQRMVTLTMLFAILRDLETDPVRADRLHRLVAVGDHPDGHLPQGLLTIQALPAELFTQVVLRRGSTELDPGVPRETMSESERNIFDNRDCIRSELLAPGMTDDDRRALADYVLDCCRLVTIVVDDADEAWEMLNTEQDTRLAFNAADEAKSVILSAMPASSHVEASHLWESCENVLVPEDMYRLLCHIRAMSWRGKYQSARPVEMEIVERFGIATDGMPFLTDHLVPHANRLKDVRRGNIGRDDGERMAAQRYIDFMTWIDPHSWVPGLLLWQKVNGPQSPHTLAFVRRLDALVWMSKIAGVDPGVLETRYLRLMNEIEAKLKPDAMGWLKVDAKVRAEAIRNLRSPNFAGKHYSGSLLRRISAVMGLDPGPIRRDDVTIEHILPRNPDGCKAWLATFRNAEACKAHHQKLGNVVLLSGRDNQKAGTLSWDEKRDILSRSPFLLAQDAATESAWTAQVIARRTERLIGVLFASFDLPPLGKGE